MKDSKYQHVCTILVGVATFFRFVGYDMSNLIGESLVHSAHVRNPTLIMDHAGYYGQAIREIAGSISTFAVPVVLNYLQPKWALVLASCLFAFYTSCYFFLNTTLYFFANIILGFTYTVTYTAFSTYQMHFSTTKTLARNSAAVWSIAYCSLIVDGLIYMLVTSRHAVPSNKSGGEQYRYYGEGETRLLAGVLTAFFCMSGVLTCCFPEREVENSVISENRKETKSLRKQIGAIAYVIVHPHTLMFIPRFVNHGLFTSFYMNVYPTSLQYSMGLSQKYPMLTAYYVFAMGAGSTIGGVLIAPLNRRIREFGLRPLYFITIFVQLVAYLLATLTVPNLSTARPTEGGSILEPNLIWVCVIAFILGLGNTTNASSNTVICTRIIRGRASHMYSAARFYYGIAASIIFFCSPILSMNAHAIILTSATILSAITFNFALNRVDMNEEKETKDAQEESVATATTTDDGRI